MQLTDTRRRVSREKNKIGRREERVDDRAREEKERDGTGSVVRVGSERRDASNEEKEQNDGVRTNEWKRRRCRRGRGTRRRRRRSERACVIIRCERRLSIRLGSQNKRSGTRDRGRGGKGRRMKSGKKKERKSPTSEGKRHTK